MRVKQSCTGILAALLLGVLVSPAEGQVADRRVTLEARGGFNVPTFDISDAVNGGPSLGVGAGYQLAPRVWLLGDVDLGFHSGADLPGGGSGPDVNVYHYMGKVGYAVVPQSQASPWSVIVNAGAGAMTFSVDGGSSSTYPAINVGAKIGYRLNPRLSFVLSPQGDIAFSDEADVGTSNSWVWPFTAGLRVGF
ncbi:MAG TPA: outer membrane beta-barrel protein [Gemmatimonadales bacterium]|nr:outer membrane beta-barrel protein [Gemmatimonadales bacterium]